MSKWLRFEEVPNPTYRTCRWLVNAKMGGALLGEIRWYGAWRQYAFFPEPDIVLAGSCFTDLAAFIESVKAKRQPVSVAG